jgi:hypothetical protein
MARPGGLPRSRTLRRPEVWLWRYAPPAVTGVVAAGLALVRAWVPAGIAVGAGTALTTALATTLGRVNGRAAELQRWPEHLARARPGRVPLVREVSTCQDWGAQPEADHRSAVPYVTRDADAELEAAIRHGGFVVLLGESAAGKSRMAGEAIRRLLPDHAWVRPFTRSAAAVAVDAACACAPSVVWLDDLENYLGPDGLTGSHLDRLLGRDGVVVVATIRTQEHRRYDAREGSRLTGTDRDLWRTERDVVARAAIVRVERLWSPAEVRRARAVVPSRRLGLALAACDRFGIAESLACGPELVHVWRDAWSPGANPRGAAVVAAVVDCRRAGLRRAVPVEWVRTAHEPYLLARGGSQLEPEPFEAALAWACQTIRATSSLLTRSGDPACLSCFDYLLGSQGMEPVPDHLWDALLPLARPGEAYDIALVAHSELRLQHAHRALLIARAGGVAGAQFALARVTGDRGHPRRAMEILRALPAHEQVSRFVLAQQLAHFQGVAGDHGQAAASFSVLARDLEEEFGRDHPDALDARNQAAYYTGMSGDIPTAIAEMSALVTRRRQVLGPDHRETLATRRSLAWFHGQAGRTGRAVTELQDLLSDAQPVLGLLDPHVLAIRSALAWYRGAAGDWNCARSELIEVLEDRQRVLGHDHPHTLTTRHEIATATANSGDTDRARALLRSLIPDMEAHLAPDHPQLISATGLLARLR